MKPFLPAHVVKTILSDVPQPLPSPLFTWYVGVREKIALERYRFNHESTAILSDKMPPGPSYGCPHVFGLNARLHAFSSSDKDLIDLRIKVMPEPG